MRAISDFLQGRDRDPLADTSSCSGGDVTGNFLKKFPASCELIWTDLGSRFVTDAAAKLGRCLDMVRIVKGRLVYKEINNTAESPCLRQLMTIEHTSDGPAIEVNHNDGLVSLGLENLKKISNKDKVVFKVHYDHYLTNATPWEVSSLVRAAGGNHEKCKEMFDVRQPGFVEPDRGVSALSWFFIIYAAVSAFIYGVILVLHVFLQPHLPKAMRGNSRFPRVLEHCP
ncbi:hypothetical protein Y032_0604g544 [Ancylostoma ceylanicum]|uniref:Receptor L-domain domain-containing protein n=1 Tax=Ancylostoma ceylanicum TaxID=53326 RepID=A0A016WMY5_9BILA|nr:hypothetical protein Y032_0604g544 [Ancylostoma ceylanicum]